MASLFFFLVGDVDRAIRYLDANPAYQKWDDPIPVNNPDDPGSTSLNPTGMALKGWAMLDRGFDRMAQGQVKNFSTAVLDAATQWFDSSLQKSLGVMEAAMGKAEVLVAKRQVPPALDIYSECMATHENWFPAAAHSQAWASLLASEFDQARDVIERAKAQQLTAADEIELGKLSVVLTVATEGPSMKVAQSVQRVQELLLQQEPNNSRILLSFASLIARLCATPTAGTASEYGSSPSRGRRVVEACIQASLAALKCAEDVDVHESSYVGACLTQLGYQK
ncbi:Tetratricopeptide repeat protein 21B, partial [Perkinsus olseni]